MFVHFAHKIYMLSILLNDLHLLVFLGDPCVINIKMIFDRHACQLFFCLECKQTLNSIAHASIQLLREKLCIY